MHIPKGLVEKKMFVQMYILPNKIEELSINKN